MPTTDIYRVRVVDASGAVVGPTATEAKQDVANTSLAAIDAGIPAALGVATLAQSLPANESSATLYAGTLATSGSAAALATTQAIREVIVQNDPDNTTDVLIGNSAAQVIQLKPGWSITIPVSDLATVYVKSVSGTPIVNYLGRS